MPHAPDAGDEAGPAAVLPLGQRVQLERHGDRLQVTIRRRQTRSFTLSEEEGAYLAGLLGRDGLR